MGEKVTPEQMRRRRGAAYELRQRARRLLEDAQMLDSWPALHLSMPDTARIAEALGISAAELVAAVETLMPATHNNDEGDHTEA